MRSVRHWSAAVAVVLGMSAPASAQIIATSIPRDASGGGSKKWSVHVMGSPYASWDIRRFDDFGFLVKSKTSSDFLLAGELAYSVGEKVTVGVGGWHNKLGTGDYTVESPKFFNEDFEGGKEDLGSLSEVHGNVFYGDFGIQVGYLFISGGVRDFAGETTTDIDAYLVYRRGLGRVGAASVGGGIYRNGKRIGGADTSEAHTRPSGFLTLSVPVIKGLTVDGSFWYIGKSSLANDRNLDDSAKRFMLGIGYTF